MEQLYLEHSDAKIKMPNNAIHRTLTRVTPPAGSLSLAWQESRHGRVPVIVDGLPPQRKIHRHLDSCLDCLSADCAWSESPPAHRIHSGFVQDGVA